METTHSLTFRQKAQAAAWVLVVAAVLFFSYLEDVRLVHGNDTPELSIEKAVEVTLYSADLQTLSCSEPHIRVWTVGSFRTGSQLTTLPWNEQSLAIASTSDNNVYVALWCHGQLAPAWELPETPGSSVVVRFSDVKTAGSIESFDYLANPE